MALTELDLLKRHIEAVWGMQLPPLALGDVEVSAGGGAAPWVLYLAYLGPREVRVWREVPARERPGLLQRARAAFADAGVSGARVAGEVAFRWEDRFPAPEGLARRLGEADEALLAVFEPGETAYWLDPRRGPLFGVVEAGRLVSIAHSSRRTAEACELGINTKVEARRRGFARACVLAWAHAVAAEGLEPIYSASVTNAASLALARSCGYRELARAMHVAGTGEGPGGDG